MYGFDNNYQFTYVPGGSRQGPRRAHAKQFTGLIRGIFLAGARVIFRLELKVTRGQKTVKISPGSAREDPFCEL